MCYDLLAPRDDPDIVEDTMPKIDEIIYIIYLKGPVKFVHGHGIIETAKGKTHPMCCFEGDK